MDPSKTQFFERLNLGPRVPVLFGISRCLAYKYFDMVLGYHSPQPRGPPKNQYFERLNLQSQFFLYISRYFRDKYFDLIWGYQPPNGSTRKSIF